MAVKDSGEMKPCLVAKKEPRGDERGDQSQHQDDVIEIDDALERRIVEAEYVGKTSFPALELDAEQRRPRNAGDAVRPVCEVVPVQKHDADDLAEGERHDGQIVATQP